MDATKQPGRRSFTAGRFTSLCAVTLLLAMIGARQSGAMWPFGQKNGCGCGPAGCPTDEVGGTWYWVRSPEDEKRVVMGLYNRYCVRCHGVDGRGVWDIPDVPDFTNARWQACRSDGQLVRAILEGRGACMPPFRGTIALDEAWAMARYLRTFIPGSETPRPDVAAPASPAAAPASPATPPPMTPR